MHKRRISDGVVEFNPSANRKKLSSQFLDRTKNDASPSLSSTVKINSKESPFKPVQNHLITSMIDEKVASLKTKFSELDDLRKKLLESRTEFRDGQENRKSMISRNKNRSTDSEKQETSIKDSNFNKTSGVFKKSLAEENLEKSLHGEKKLTQKAILEKKILEREVFETSKKHENELKSLSNDLESLKQQFFSCKHELKHSEKIRKNLEMMIQTQGLELEHFKSSLDASNSEKKKMAKKIEKLEEKLKNSEDQWTKTSAIKNLSSIILSKESSFKLENFNMHITNKYLEALSNLQNSDSFALELLEKLEKTGKNQEKFRNSKDEIQNRIEKTLSVVEELKSFVCQPTASGPSFDKKKTDELVTDDFLCFLKSQAGMVEELLMITQVIDD